MWLLCSNTWSNSIISVEYAQKFCLEMKKEKNNGNCGAGNFSRERNNFFLDQFYFPWRSKFHNRDQSINKNFVKLRSSGLQADWLRWCRGECNSWWTFTALVPYGVNECYPVHESTSRKHPNIGIKRSRKSIRLCNYTRIFL